MPVKGSEALCSLVHLGRFAQRTLLCPGPALRRTQMERNQLPLQASRFVAVFANFPKLILGYALERLMRAAPRPIHFDAFNLRGFAQAYVLLKRRRSKRPAASHGAVDCALLLAFVLHGDFNPGPDCRAVALDTHELQINPVVPAGGIRKQPQRVAIAGSRPSRLGHNVLVAAAFEVREGDPVPLVKLTGS